MFFFCWSPWLSRCPLGGILSTHETPEWLHVFGMNYPIKLPLSYFSLKTAGAVIYGTLKCTMRYTVIQLLLLKNCVSAL